jgi:hypothetical protein
VNSPGDFTAQVKVQRDPDDVRRMMLNPISEETSNSEATIRQEFRKLRF